MDGAKIKAFMEVRRADPALAEQEWRRTRFASIAFLAVFIAFAAAVAVFGFTGDLPGAGIALGMAGIGATTGWIAGLNERSALVHAWVKRD